jgi:hypothetical protein
VTDVLKQLLIDTLRDPRGAAPKVLAIPLSAQVWWLILAIVVALNAVIYGVFLSFQAPIGVLPLVTNNPFGYALATGGMFVALVMMFHWIGGWMGGKGTLRDTLAIVSWLHAVQLVVLTVLSLLGLVLGGLASMLSLGFSVYFFWMLMCFLKEAHQLNSLGQSFLLMVFGHIGAVLALSFLLVLAGVSPVGPV